MQDYNYIVKGEVASLPELTVPTTSLSPRLGRRLRPSSRVTYFILYLINILIITFIILNPFCLCIILYYIWQVYVDSHPFLIIILKDI